MEKTLVYHYKPTNTDLDVPVTTTFPKGKVVWNIGEHNPYIKDGYVILCSTDKNYSVIPNSLEFLYVGTSENAKILHDAAGSISIGINTLTKMKRYENKYHSDVVHKAANIVEKYMK